MAIIYGPLNPPAAATYEGSSQLGGTHTGADGDIWIHSTNRRQMRFSSTPTPVWTQIVPSTINPRTTLSDTRGDVVPFANPSNHPDPLKAGQPPKLNDRLAQISGSPWGLGWANAAEGLVATHNQDPALSVWAINHSLSSRWVDVTVISPGETDPNEPQNIIVPEIEFVTDMACRLTFIEPVAGTALIRR